MNKDIHISVLKEGLQTLIQDQGRMGYQDVGVPIGGAMDKSSAKIANQLVGNDANSPVLEIAMIGPILVFDQDCQIALSGADLSAVLNHESLEMYRTISVPGGSLLTFGRPLAGCRTYLAVRGKWQVPQWLGSYSAFFQAGMELPKGSVLKKGDRIRISSAPVIRTAYFPTERRPTYPSYIRVKVMPGPEFELFDRHSIAYFFGRKHQLASESNRMGYRLLSYLPHFSPQSELISSGVVPGTIQITHSGQPIILMADAQTTGGYFRIANVVSEEMDRLAQLKPGEKVSFELV